MLCAIGKTTKETVIAKFQLNNLVSEEMPSGYFFVIKPEEFDIANQKMSAQFLAEHNILNSFWVRSGSTARFNNTFAQLADLVINSKENTNGSVAVTESTDGVMDSPHIFSEGLPQILVPKNWKSPC